MIQLRGLHPQLRAAAESLVAYAASQGVQVQVTSTARSCDEQRALYRNYQQCLQLGLFPSDRALHAGMSCRWPANPPGSSAHNYGLAWDSVVAQPAHQAFWNALRRWQGWEVPANDEIHAEYPQWARYVTRGCL